MNVTSQHNKRRRPEPCGGKGRCWVVLIGHPHHLNTCIRPNHAKKMPLSVLSLRGNALEEWLFIRLKCQRPKHIDFFKFLNVDKECMLKKNGQEHVYIAFYPCHCDCGRFLNYF